MARALASLLAAALCGASLAPAHAAEPSKAPLDCGMGPITKTFGGTPWLVYACADGASVVALSAPGSPASPFYFFMHARGGPGSTRLAGEGTGDAKATDRALAELKTLGDAQILALHAEAKAHGPTHN